MPEGTIFEKDKIPPQNLPDTPEPAEPPQAFSSTQEPHSSVPLDTSASGSPEGPPQPPVPPDHSDSFFSRLPFKKLLLITGLLFLGLVILIVIASLAGKKTSEPANVTLNYWGLWEDEGPINSVISDFQKENPKIKITYVKQDPTDYREKLNFRIPKGTGPDIFRFHNSWYPMISEFLSPFPQDLMKKEEFESNYYDVIKKDLIKNGNIYGIPLGIDTLVMYVNPQIFQQREAEQGKTFSVPVTWQEFISTSQALTKRNTEGKIDISGAAIGTFENIDYAPDILSLLFVQNGVNLENISASSQKISDALQFYTNFALIENNTWDETLDPSLLAFSSGKVAMAFGYARDYETIKSLNPGLSFKAYPVPQLLREKSINIASYFAEGVSAKSPNPKEAFLFMKYLARPEVSEKLYREAINTKTIGEPYSNKKLADLLLGTEAEVFINQAKTAVSSSFADKTFDKGLNTDLNNSLKEAIGAILGGDSSESGAEILFQGYQTATLKYGNASKL